MKDYSLLYNKINPASVDDLIKFVRSEKEIQASSSSKISQTTSRFFRTFATLVKFEKLHSYKEAQETIKYYLYYATDEQRDDILTEKVLSLFDELSTVPRENKPGTYTTGIKRAWIERLQKQRAELPPEPKQSVDKEAEGYPLHLVDSEKIPTMSARLLFQIEADEFGLHSNLEGTAKKHPLAYVGSYIQERVSQGDHLCNQQQELIRELAAAHEIASSPNMKETLNIAIHKAFATKQPLLIPGGWVGTPSGHAMYYELIPEAEEAKATLRIFNTGEGIQEHERFQVGVKDKIRFAEWKGISREKLLDPHFALAVEEMNTHIVLPEDANKKTDYNFLDIYHGLRDFLEVKEENRVNEDSVLNAPLMQPQRAGTCTYRSLMMFVKSKMELNEFRRFKCDISIQALASYALSPPNPEEISAKEITETGRWRLIRKSLQHITRRVNRMHSRHIVGTAYVEQAQKALKQVAELVVQHNGSLEQPQQLAKTIFRAPDQNIQIPYDPKSISVSKTTPEAKTESNATHGIACSHLMESLKKYKLNDPTTIGQEIQEVCSLLQEAHKRREYSAINFAAVEFAKKLNIEEAFWNQIPGDQKDVERVIEDLNSIGNVFFTSCYHCSQPNCIFPEQLYTTMKLFYTQSMLAERLYPAFSMAVRLNFGDMRFYFQSQDEQIEREIAYIYSKIKPNIKIPDFLRKKEDKEQKPQVLQVSTSYDPYNKSKVREIKNNPHNDLTEFVQQHYPHVIEKIRKEDPQYSSCSPVEQGLRLYTSPHLPTWLKSLRDTRLRIFHLDTAHIVPVAENASLQFEFTIDKRDQKNPQVVVSVDGITLDSLKVLPRGAIDGCKTFESTQRQMISEPMQKILNPLQDEDRSITSRNEKDFLTKKMKSKVPEYSEERTKELAHPFITENFRLIEIVEYFSRYPDRIKDPDYQQILQMALFGRFDIRLSNAEAEITPIILDFITKNLKHYMAQNDIGTSVFLIRMNRYLSHYENFKGNTVDGAQLIKGLLENQGLLPEEKSLLYSELIGHLAEKEILSEEDIQGLLIASVWVKDTPLPKKWDDPKYLWETGKALQKHSKAIEKLLAPEGVINLPLLKAVFSGSKEKETDAEWKCVQAPGEALRLVSTAGDVYDPLQGRLFAIGQETYIPSEIRDMAEFRYLFPNQLKAQALPGDIYTFNDAAGNSIFVKKEDGFRLIIEQERNGKKYYFVSNLSLECRYLNDRYTHWKSIDNPVEITLIDRKLNKEGYILKLKVTSFYMLEVDTITRISDNAILSKSSKLFCEFESPSYIHEWYNDQQNLVEIEIPRFSLSFKPDPEDSNRLDCVQYPGWTLATDQTMQALGGCTYHLILIGPQGKRRVILPNQALQAPKEKEVLEPRIERNQELEQGKDVDFDHYIYDVDTKGRLKATSREAYLHLVETLAAHQEYDLAAALLKQHGEKLSAYSPQEITHLDRICKINTVTGDESGEQNAIALYAAYLLATNPIQSETAVEALPNLYKNYLVHFYNTTALQLTRDEELRLLKNILSQKTEPSLLIRLRELDPDYVSKMRLSAKPSGSNKGTAINVKEYLERMQLPYKMKEPKTDNKLLTRGASLVKDHLFYFITQAIEGTPAEKKWLHDAAIFFRSNSSGETRALGVLIHEILEEPSRFTLPPAGYNEREKWWKKTIAQLHQEKLETRSASDEKAFPDITVPHYRLQKTSPPLPSIPFSFAIDEMPPLSQDGNLLLKVSDALENEEKKENRGLNDWMNNQKKSVSAEEDPLQALEWERLADDLAFYQQNTSVGVRVKASAQIPVTEIHQPLQSQINSDQVDIRDLEAKIMQLANRLPEGDLERVQHEMQQWGATQKNISLDDIFISIAQKNPAVLQMLNRRLGENDIQVLYSMAGQYLQLSTRIQQCERCIGTCQKLERLSENASPTEKQELEKQLVNDFLAKREYSSKAHPAYLVFEYYAGILMRKEQVVKLDQFISGKVVNPVMEMIMGSGKSKILLPLLGLMRADGKTLSMLVVPSPLFESVSSDTQKILKEAFGKVLRTLHFDRNTTFTRRSLEEIRDTLKEVIENKECLIMTSKSIQSLLLKCIEQANQSFRSKEYLTDEILLMQEIITLLSTCGNPLIDEADTVLNVLHEVSFSLGGKSNPKEHEIRLIGKIYHLLYNDPKIKAIAQLESDPSPDPHAPVLTEESYFSTLQRPLAEAMLAHLATASLGNSRLDEQLHRYLATLDTKNRGLLLDYLCRNASTMAEAQRYEKSLPDNLQEVFALLGEELSHLLPHTLTRVSDQNYGLDKDILAIPYKASQTPNTGSLFSNSYITMNYTYQIHFKNGISKQTIEEQIGGLQRKAMFEMDESGGTMIVSDTDAWKTFCLLKGDLNIPLFNYNESQIENLVKHVNSTPEIKEKIIAGVFLPQLELFDQKLSCNQISFASLFKKISGFTGTLWIAASMHRKLAPMPEKGTDAKTISLLWNMGLDNVHVIPKNSVDTMLNTIQSQGIAFDMISDAGGYFKEGNNLAIARKMALKSGKPVVFYNSKGEQAVTNGKDERSFASARLSEEERLTFLDQSHTTGADVKQRMEAIGLVTIGRNMLLRDLLQSVWRLRGLEKGQKVTFMIDEEVESIIRHSLHLNEDVKIGFPEILKFVIVNQSKQQGSDNFKSFKNQVWDLPQSLLLDTLLRKDISPQRREKAIGLLMEMWVKPANSSATTLYGSPAMERPSPIVIDEETGKCKAFLKVIRKELPFLADKIDAFQKEIDLLAKLTLKRVHPQIISPLADDSETVEIEQDTQTETLVEVEVETQVTSEEGKVKLGIQGGLPQKVEDITPKLLREDYKLPLFPIERQMEREPALREFAPFFKDVLISLNVLEWEEGEKDLTKFRLFGPHRTPFHHLRVEGDEVTLFSTVEVKMFGAMVNYNLFTGFTKGAQEISPAAFEKVTKLKFLNGESTFNKKELEFLGRWIREAGSERMLRLFRIVLNNQPDKVVAFAGSPLHKVFSKLHAQ